MSKVIIGKQPATTFLQYDDTTNQLSIISIDNENNQTPSNNIISGNNSDYTAFQVFAHDYDIPIGSCAELNGEIYYAIPSDMCHKFQIRSEDLPETQDIIIDWGDGTVEALSSFAVESISGSEGDWRYTLEHTYTENGKYIIKIFGKKYFALINGVTSSDSNIICRVFDEDLPVASHISNFSSFARRSRRLLSVDVSKCNNFNKNFTNIANMFVSCPNLETAIGFRSINKINCYYASLFNSCYSLKTCDLTISNCFDLSNIFKKCYYLELDIDSFFKYFNVTDEVSIPITSSFASCGGMYGTVPAHKLWNNKNITWTDTSEAFKGCSADIKAQVPTSWGGTNEMLDIQLKITDEMKSDYTAFQVFAHDYDIPIGSCAELNGEIYYAIPSDMCHKFQIRSEDVPETQDIIIDWGDGTLEDLSKYTIEKISGGEGDWKYTLEHTYAENGKYIIKIFGKKYFTLINGITSSDSNIICRVFDEDLPVASHISNFSSFARRTRRLLSVDVSKCNNFNKNFTNISNMFMSCTNLEKAIGFGSVNKINCSYSSLFENCYSLKTCDLTISNCFDLSNIFKRCYYVKLDIDSFFKYFNVIDKVNISITSLFTSCGSVYGTVPAHKLWNNKNITWTNTSEAFKGCSADIKSQVPTSWGGTASDDIIQKSSTIIQVPFSIVPQSEYENATDIAYIENTETISFTKQQLGVNQQFEFHIINQDGYNITTDSRLNRRWYNGAYEISFSDGWKSGNYKLKKC